MFRYVVPENRWKKYLKDENFKTIFLNKITETEQHDKPNSCVVVSFVATIFFFVFRLLIPQFPHSFLVIGLGRSCLLTEYASCVFRLWLNLNF